MKVYIAGKITGDPQFRQKFKSAEELLTEEGHLVMNPAVFPEGFEHHEYMKICLCMLDACDCIYLLPGWKTSKGANMEFNYAIDHGKLIRQFGSEEI